jgi:general secretion pathway protein D
MVIGGLIQNDAERGKTGVPGLANIPVMGWLFKRETSSAPRPR